MEKVPEEIAKGAFDIVNDSYRDWYQAYLELAEEIPALKEKRFVTVKPLSPAEGGEGHNLIRENDTCVSSVQICISHFRVKYTT